MSHNKRSVLLTGASRGIGKAIHGILKEKGYDIAAPSRSELDLADPVSINNFIENNKLKKYDVLINNAGINPIFAIENLPEDQIDEVIQINLKAPMLLTKMVFSGMKSRNFGRIINISSIWSKVGKIGRASYASTKSGISGFSRHIAIEGAEYNVLVNTVAPGFVNTELTKKNNTKDDIKAISNNIPIKRLAEPSEIAEYVAFLVSDKNTYITGQELFIDGGFTIQ